MKTLSRNDLSGLTTSAIFSECEVYRYRLDWLWNEALPPLYAVMLNPSTATHLVLDATVSGLCKRARTWGLGGVVVGNLFAFRATDPADMRRASDPVGPDNDGILRAIFREAADCGHPILAAWGRHGRHRARDAVVLSIADECEALLLALRLNSDGTPEHPLYIPHAVRPMLAVPRNADASAQEISA